MTDDPIRRYLRSRGVADHVAAGGFAGLVADWERTAEAVETRIRTDARRLPERPGRTADHQVVLSATPEPDGPLRARIRRADGRMRAACVPAGRCVWADGADDTWHRSRNWWYFVVPRRPGPALADDLSGAGHAPATPDT